jgi:hypothetical protein
VIKLILVLILVNTNAWSRVGLELVLDNSTVKQGEIVVGRLIVKQTDGQAILGGLKGKKLGKTLYLLQVSPFMGKQGHLEAETKLIFLAVPQTAAASEVINGEEVFISWNNIEVMPTESPKSFLLGDFEIPARKKIFQWMLIGLGVLLILGIIVFFRRSYLKNQDKKKRISSIKNELVNCTTYNDIVEMWNKKQDYIEAFPDLDKNFKNLEAVLFKYQFKPQRNETEIKEVISAYNKFKTSVSEVINVS